MCFHAGFFMHCENGLSMNLNRGNRLRLMMWLICLRGSYSEVSSSRSSVCSFYNIFPDKFPRKSFLHFCIKSYLVGPSSIFVFNYLCSFVRVQAQRYSEEAFLPTPVSLGTLIEHQSNERQR